MAERRERPSEIEPEELLPAEIEAVNDEESLVLPPPSERPLKTLASLKAKLTPASKSRHALDERQFMLDREITKQQEREQKITSVLQELEKTAGKLETRYSGLMRIFAGDKVTTARAAVEAVREALEAEEAKRKELEDELRAFERQEGKLLSAMQPDVRELKKLEKKESFGQTLRETLAYLKAQRPDSLARVTAEMVKMMKSTYPEFEAEINLAFSAKK